MIVINLKNYKFGKNNLALAKTIQKYIPKSIVCPPSADITLLKHKTSLTIYAQHVSSLSSGRNTGYDIPESIKAAGASGSLINHSEHRIPFSQIKRTVKRLNDLKLKSIVCVANLRETKKVLKLSPTAIAFEDPILVGSGKSITQYKPKTILKFTSLFKKSKIIPLCGAGINTALDVSQAKALGCNGVLIASAIAKSKNPLPLLRSLK
jgi:triosephosphate isomerase (TIM)